MWHQREEDLEDESVYSVWNFFTSAELRRRILGMSFIWYDLTVKENEIFFPGPSLRVSRNKFFLPTKCINWS